MDNNGGQRGGSWEMSRAAHWFSYTSYPDRLALLSDEALQGLLEQGHSVLKGAAQYRDPKFSSQIQARIGAIEQALAQRRCVHKIILPPRLVYDGLLRRLVTPAAYNRYIVPHVADMHEEYFSCLSKRDESGARWAIIRGHLYVIPTWVWAFLGQLLARVLGR